MALETALLALCAAAAALRPSASAAAAAAPAPWRPPPPRDAGDPPFVTAGHGSLGRGDPGSGARPAARRLVYYAHLPDVPATAAATAAPRRWPLSYSIVDADAGADALPQADRPRRREFPPPPPGARYDRPQPYYHPRPAPPYYSYSDDPYSARQPDLDYSARRPDIGYSARQPDLDYSARRPDIGYSARQPDLDYPARWPGRDFSARRPELSFARRPEAEGQPVSEPRRQGAAYRGPQAVALEDPYRGYNPRQPAPWSLQVGARLTVRDDGRRLPLGGGGGGGGPGGRRFYVNSQPPGPHYAVPLRYS